MEYTDHIPVIDPAPLERFFFFFLNEHTLLYPTVCGRNRRPNTPLTRSSEHQGPLVNSVKYITI